MRPCKVVEGGAAVAESAALHAAVPTKYVEARGPPSLHEENAHRGPRAPPCPPADEGNPLADTSQPLQGEREDAEGGAAAWIPAMTGAVYTRSVSRVT